MQRIAFLLIPVIILGYSCHPTGQSAQTAADTVAVTGSTPEAGIYQGLLSQYRDLSFDTFPVFPSDVPDDTTFQFHGRLLDTTTVRLLVNDVDLAVHNFHDGFFACYKFNMDNGRIGLITRVPSEYLSSSIRLFILDTHQQKITEQMELAEDFGDAGDAMSKITWLFRNGQLQLQALQNIHFSHDNSVDDEKDTTVVESDAYYLIGLSKEKNDTISSDSLTLANRFMQLKLQ